MGFPQHTEHTDLTDVLIPASKNGVKGNVRATNLKGQDGASGASGEGVYPQLKNTDGSITSAVSLIPTGKTFSVASYWPDSHYPQSRPNGTATYKTFTRTGTEAADDGGAVIYLSANVYAKLVNTSSVIDGYQWGLAGKGEDASVIFQKMLDYASFLNTSFNASFTDESSLFQVFDGDSPKISIPSGRYSWSTPVTCSAYYADINFNDALIMPTAAFVTLNQPAITFTNHWRSTITKPRFHGFHMQAAVIDIDSANNDTGSILIEQPSFQDNELCMHVKAQSSITTINSGWFVNNRKIAFIEKADRIIFNDFWFSDGNRDGHQSAAIENGTPTAGDPVLVLNKGILVPRTPSGSPTESAWVNNYALVRAYGVRAGSEPGSMTLVNQLGAADTSYTFIHNGVIAENCQCTAAYGNGEGNFQPAVVRIINHPNHIKITGTTNMLDSNLIDYSADVADPVALIASQGLTDPAMEKHFWLDIHGNKESEYPFPSWVEVNGEPLPPALIPYVRDYAGSGVSAGVATVTGSAVDNTDPANPVINSGVDGADGADGTSVTVTQVANEAAAGSTTNVIYFWSTT